MKIERVGNVFPPAGPRETLAEEYMHIDVKKENGVSVSMFCYAENDPTSENSSQIVVTLSPKETAWLVMALTRQAYSMNTTDLGE